MNTTIFGPWINETLVTKFSHTLSANYISTMEYGGALNTDGRSNAFDSNSFPLLPTAEPFTGWSQSSLKTDRNFSALQGLVVYGPETSK